MVALAGTKTEHVTSRNSQASAAVSQSSCDCAPRRADARKGRNLAFFPALLLAVLPKCPVCLAAWLGVFGASMGVIRLMNTVWGIPVITVLLLCIIVALALQAREGRRYRPIAVGVLGCAVILFGKFLFDLPVLTYGGVLVIFIASLSVTSSNLSNLKRSNARDTAVTKSHPAPQSW